MFAYVERQETISNIMEMFKKGELIIDDSYQRKSVWNDKDKVALVETILLNMVIPELFFWKADTNPDTGRSTIHIVDGQQRVKAISDFVSNVIKLDGKWLQDAKIKELYEGRYFKDFTDEEKKNFWNYNLFIIDIDRRVERDTIIKMFQRLNMTDYNLNAQEKRHVKSGDFHVLACELADNEFWDQVGIFTGKDIRRMLDVEYCANIILLWKEGIVNQTNQEALNRAYEDYANDVKNLEKDKGVILEAIEQIKMFYCSEIKKFVSRKGQLYTLFSWIFHMRKTGKKIEEGHIDRFKNFVVIYELLDDRNIKNIGEEERIIVDLIEQYRNASAGNFNSHINRTRRLNVLKEFLNNDDNDKRIDLLLCTLLSDRSNSAE